MAMTTPRVMPIFFIAHLSAFSAFFWARVSIVSVSDAPGSASWMVCSTCVRRPVASRATLSEPYVPRSSVSYCASSPTLPIRSSGW